MGRIGFIVFGVIAAACGAGDLGVSAAHGEAAYLNARCTLEDQDCCEACVLVNECRPEVSVETCEERCLDSNFILRNQSHCLAMRVLWIDEEGCDVIGPTWDRFDDDDFCID